MTQKEINDLLERPQPTCASMLDMPMYESPHLAAIADALEHAKRKHPFFADVAVSYLDFRKAVDQIAIAREYLADKVKANRCGGMTVLMCEVYEAIEAFSRKDYAATMDELAQCGAVVVRMMEAVQELADEAAKAAKAGKEEN